MRTDKNVLRPNRDRGFTILPDSRQKTQSYCAFGSRRLS